MQMQDWRLIATHLIVDHDTKFTESFDEVFEAQDARIISGWSRRTQRERLR